MSQKLPFNINSAPTVRTPVATPVLLHRFGNTGPVDQEANLLWNLHLWAFSNDVPSSSPVTLEVRATPVQGGPPTGSSPLLTRRTQPNQFVIYKLLDGIPIRGPLDVWVTRVSGGDTDSALGVFGYVMRGEQDFTKEHRFFSGAAIGNSGSGNFSGGKAVLLIDPAPSVTIQEMFEEGRIDEITLDVVETEAQAVTVQVTITDSEVPILVQTAVDPVRIFDGQPFFDASDRTISAEPITAGVTTEYSGYFTRA